jgi:outer membrane protein assembly factor BamE (lipoprotein component of BamABCDE complex)
LSAQITDQRVVAIYFDKDRRVERIASYGIKDGKIFDFISRTTPTAGSDLNFLKQLMYTIENGRLGMPF